MGSTFMKFVCQSGISSGSGSGCSEPSISVARAALSVGVRLSSWTATVSQARGAARLGGGYLHDTHDLGFLAETDSKHRRIAKHAVHASHPQLASTIMS